MSVERSSHVSSPEREYHSPDFAVFIAGMGGTYKGNASTEASLQKVYGEENVRIFNSQLSADGPDPEKFSTVGRLVQEKITSGTHIDMIVNSLGGVELYEAIKDIEKREPDFFADEEHLRGMDVTLISPVGFVEGMRGNLSFIRNLAAFLHEETQMPLVASMESVRGGIASINTLPPDEIPRDVLVDGLRSALGDLSQKEEGFEEIDYTPDRDLEDQISDEDREKLLATDASLYAAIEQRNDRGVKEMLKKRGKILAPYTLQKFAGEHLEEPPLTEQFSWTPGVAWGTLGLLEDMIAGKSMQKIDDMRQKGMKVNFAVPEYDVVFPLKDVIDFFETPDEAKENTVILPVTTHNSFVLSTDTLVELMQHLRDRV